MVVQNYTSRNLTKQEDKLPALAVLTSAFQAQLDNPYHAGLFEHDLLRGLMWQTQNPTTATTPSQSHGPSWSWVSVEGPVAFYCLRFIGVDLHRHASSILAVKTYPERSQTKVISQEMRPTTFRILEATTSAPAERSRGAIAEHTHQPLQAPPPPPPPPPTPTPSPSRPTVRWALRTIRGPFRSAQAEQVDGHNEKEPMAPFCHFGTAANGGPIAQRARKPERLSGSCT